MYIYIYIYEYVYVYIGMPEGRQVGAQVRDPREEHLR